MPSIGRVNDSDDRMLVILDLDHTIICALEEEMKEKSKIPKSSDTYKNSLVFEEMYRIYPRPGLDRFLQQLFKKYRVAVWTAAGSSYAMFIVEHFILPKKYPSRRLEFFQWSEHCDHSEDVYDHQKKLELLVDIEPGPKVILDDSVDVMQDQQKYVVDSRLWDVTKKNADRDDFLLTEALPEIKKKLQSQKEYVLKSQKEYVLKSKRT